MKSKNWATKKIRELWHQYKDGKITNAQLQEELKKLDAEGKQMDLFQKGDTDDCHEFLP